MNDVRKPIGVGPAFDATPEGSFEKRDAGERRPYIGLHRYGCIG
jgi:hypothetical protein